MVPPDITVTGSGRGIASSGSSQPIVTSSARSCGRSMRYEMSAGSVSAWNPCARPAAMYNAFWGVAGQLEVSLVAIDGQAGARLYHRLDQRAAAAL